MDAIMRNRIAIVVCIVLGLIGVTIEFSMFGVPEIAKIAKIESIDLAGTECNSDGCKEFDWHFAYIFEDFRFDGNGSNMTFGIFVDEVLVESYELKKLFVRVVVEGSFFVDKMLVKNHMITNHTVRVIVGQDHD